MVVGDSRDDNPDNVRALADEEGDDDKDEHQSYLLLFMGDYGLDSGICCQVIPVAGEHTR